MKKMHFFHPLNNFKIGFLESDGLILFLYMKYSPFYFAGKCVKEKKLSVFK